MEKEKKGMPTEKNICDNDFEHNIKSTIRMKRKKEIRNEIVEVEKNKFNVSGIWRWTNAACHHIE